MKITGFNSLTELFTSLFNFKYPIFLGFFASFIGIINHFIQYYIWADPSQYGFLIILILIDFILGLVKAQKFKMLDPKKIPRFLITIFTYTLFLYMAFTGAKMLPILVFLPPLAFALFVLTTMLSIIRNLGSIGWLYQPIADFFENKIGMKIKEVLKLDIDNVSNEYLIKIQGIITDVHNYTDAKGVALIDFQGHTFKFQNPQTVGIVKNVVGDISINQREVMKLTDLEDFFDCLGINDECIKQWERGNKYNLSNTYIFKLEGIKNSILPPLLIIDCSEKIEGILENDVLVELRKSCDKLIFDMNKMNAVKEESKKIEKEVEVPSQKMDGELNIPQEEQEDNFEEIGDLFNIPQNVE